MPTTHIMMIENIPVDNVFFVPLGVTFLSAVVLLWQVSQRIRRGPKERSERASKTSTIVCLDIARLLSCLFLLGITAYTSFIKSVDNKWNQYALEGIYGYTSVLALSALILSSLSSILKLKTHLNWVLFIVWLIFVYRDLWPLATYNLIPADAWDAPLLWVKIGVLTLAAVIVPLISPRVYDLNDLRLADAEPSPEQTASVLSRAFVSFLDPLVLSASRAHVPLEKLPSLCETDSMESLESHAVKRIESTGTGLLGHVFWTLLRIYFWKLVELVFLLFLMDVAYLGSPFAMNKILSFLETGGQGATIKPWIWISLLFVAPVAVSLSSVRYMSGILRIVAQLKAIMTEAIFDHALKMRLIAHVDDKGADSASASDEQTPQDNSSPEDESTTAVDLSSVKAGSDNSSHASRNMLGNINNLITTDIGMLDNANDLLLGSVMTPFQIILNIIFLYYILGWSIFVGLATMIVMLSVPGNIARLYHNVQVEKMKRSDDRVQLITEVMGSAIRMVKLFGWEEKMSRMINEKRQQEVNAIWRLKAFNLSNRIMNNIIPVATMVVTFATYTLVMKQELTASRVFPAIEVFTILERCFAGGGDQLASLLRAKVSLDRMSNFLRKTVLLDIFSFGQDEISAASDGGDGVKIRAMSFTWGKEDGGSTPRLRSPRFKLIIDGEVAFKQDGINLVIGSTGAGKTSLLLALLGEMHGVPLGANALLNLPRQSGVAYHAQESWVLNDTIQNNILFGSAYNEERYKNVIEQCALEPDLALFSAGDQAEVGERGITLSGGQKARVTLARAVYSKAQLLLLDDVLAALDVHTAQWIVEKCFKGDLIRGRTVILVTHNVALTSSIADYVVALREGLVVSQGSLSNALERDETLIAEVVKDNKMIQKVTEDTMDEKEAKPQAETQSGKLVVEEEISEGHVGWSALKLLLGNTGSGFSAGLFWLSFIGMVFVSKITSALQMWFLGLWARQYDVKNPADISVPYWMSLYLMSVAATLLLICLSSVVFVWGTLRASRLIHKELVDTILHSTLRWLDVTPSSRIIARCTQDIDAVDNSIVNYVHSLTEMTTMAVVRFGAVIVMSPIFGIPGALLCVIGVWVGNLFMKAQLAVKREMSNARAPIVGHISAAINGLVSIRAYGAQDMFRRESFERINRYTRAVITYNNLTRWISCRAELLAAAFSTALAAYLVYGKAYDASRTGFSLEMAVSFSHVILWIVRYFNEFEVEGNSLERIQQYLVIDQEPRPIPDGVPPASWPTSGDLKVEHLTARYSIDGPEVLHDVSFSLESGERVAIVGRTGSGKTSLTLALLRAIITRGTVYYSGLATDSVNLDALRSHITIIPQIPELLTGTLRENLDPFGQSDDAALNDALAASGLFSLHNGSGEANCLSLDSPIASGGRNLSVGQRQIIALARAIVRQSKLMILDEATSAIDYETDAVIQHSLRQRVASGVTLLTVAHRLQTVMDYDKILVLDAGRLVEVGKPSELLTQKDGLLRALVDASGDREKLYEMAKGH